MCPYIIATTVKGLLNCFWSAVCLLSLPSDVGQLYVSFRLICWWPDIATLSCYGTPRSIPMHISFCSEELSHFMDILQFCCLCCVNMKCFDWPLCWKMYEINHLTLPHLISSHLMLVAYSQNRDLWLSCCDFRSCNLLQTLRLSRFSRFLKAPSSLLVFLHILFLQ